MVAELVYTPSSEPMKNALGVSGSGTNFVRIYERDPNQRYIVFSNSP